MRYPSHELSVYKDASGQWRWNVMHVNHHIVAASTESYKKRSAAISNLSIVTGVAFTKPPRSGGFSAKANLLGKIRVTLAG